jgi:twitching motility protein PilT
MLATLTQSRREHIITLENPVEFLIDPGTSWVNQRQVPTHTESFARALRAALREDPDVIAITELRDRESIGLALSAAETGHLVLGTLHTGSAGQTIDRVINAFPGPEQDHVRSMLSESLRAVISQRLVPRANGNGRALALEVLICTTAVANMIRDNKTFQLPSIMQTGVSLGMITLDNSLADLVQKGTVAKEEARRFATAKERFK